MTAAAAASTARMTFPRNFNSILDLIVFWRWCYVKYSPYCCSFFLFFLKSYCLKISWSFNFLEAKMVVCSFKSVLFPLNLMYDVRSFVRWRQLLGLCYQHLCCGSSFKQMLPLLLLLLLHKENNVETFSKRIDSLYFDLVYILLFFACYVLFLYIFFFCIVLAKNNTKVNELLKFMSLNLTKTEKSRK